MDDEAVARRIRELEVIVAFATVSGTLDVVAKNSARLAPQRAELRRLRAIQRTCARAGAL